MSFVNALIWIAVIYVIYYLIVFGYDVMTSRVVRETTGVDEFTVHRPDDKPVKVVESNHFDYQPKSAQREEQDEKYFAVPLPEDDGSDDESKGNAFAEKKK